MSLVWPNKDPDELLDYSVDWTSALGTLTITNVAWSVRSTRYATEVPLAAGNTMTFGSGGVHIDGIQNISQSLHICLHYYHKPRDYTSTQCHTSL
jgi:hypothetical protein